MRVLAGPIASHLKPDDVPGQHVVGLLVLKGPGMTEQPRKARKNLTKPERQLLSLQALQTCRLVDASAVVQIVIRDGKPDVQGVRYRMDESAYEALLGGITKVICRVMNMELSHTEKSFVAADQLESVDRRTPSRNSDN